MEAEVFINLLEGIRRLHGATTTTIVISTSFQLGTEDCYAHLLWDRNLPQQGREDADRFWLFR